MTRALVIYFILLPVTALVLVISALVSIARTTMEDAPKVLWVLAALFLPLLGPVLWFAIGRSSSVKL